MISNVKAHLDQFKADDDYCNGTTKRDERCMQGIRGRQASITDQLEAIVQNGKVDMGDVIQIAKNYYCKTHENQAYTGEWACDQRRRKVLEKLTQIIDSGCNSQKTRLTTVSPAPSSTTLVDTEHRLNLGQVSFEKLVKNLSLTPEQVCQQFKQIKSREDTALRSKNKDNTSNSDSETSESSTSSGEGIMPRKKYRVVRFKPRQRGSSRDATQARQAVERHIQWIRDQRISWNGTENSDNARNDSGIYNLSTHRQIEKQIFEAEIKRPCSQELILLDDTTLIDEDSQHATIEQIPLSRYH